LSSSPAGLSVEKAPSTGRSRRWIVEAGQRDQLCSNFSCAPSSRLTSLWSSGRASWAASWQSLQGRLHDMRMLPLRGSRRHKASLW